MRQLCKLTIFLRFFVLTGFPSLFFPSFFFLGRPFFLPGTPLSDISRRSSARGKKCQKYSSVEEDGYQNQMNK